MAADQGPVRPFLERGEWALEEDEQAGVHDARSPILFQSQNFLALLTRGNAGLFFATFCRWSVARIEHSRTFHCLKRVLYKSEVWVCVIIITPKNMFNVNIFKVRTQLGHPYEPLATNLETFAGLSLQTYFQRRRGRGPETVPISTNNVQTGIFHGSHFALEVIQTLLASADSRYAF